MTNLHLRGQEQLSQSTHFLAPPQSPLPQEDVQKIRQIICRWDMAAEGVNPPGHCVCQLWTMYALTDALAKAARLDLDLVKA